MDTKNENDIKKYYNDGGGDGDDNKKHIYKSHLNQLVIGLHLVTHTHTH